MSAPRTIRPTVRAALAGALAAVLVGTLAAAAPAGADPPAPADPPVATTADRGGSYQVTLLTGDVVGLTRAPGGEQSVWMVETVGDAPPRIVERDGQVHVVPLEAEPYLAAGVLDPQLFNLTYLTSHGFDDASRSDLPLLVADPAGPAPLALPAGATPGRRLESIDTTAVRADKQRVRRVWEALRGAAPAAAGAPSAALAGASRVWLNGRVEATLADSVPLIGAPAAWDSGFDGSGVRVAVLDTGYDPEHPDLAGQVVATENFTTEPDATDRHGHGTHVAATVAGTGAAGGGGAHPGVAPGADLLVGKVLDRFGFGDFDWLLAGLEWAAGRADVVNVSIGAGFSDGNDPLSVMVDELTETTGTLFVVSAGNAGAQGEQTITAPGTAASALTVGASTKGDTVAGFSSRGLVPGSWAAKPDLLAPGAGIVAARASGTALGAPVDAHHTSLSGTSMAAPHVAGAAAVLAQQHPDWGPGALKDRLMSTSVALPREPVVSQGAGRVDLAAAVAHQVSGPGQLAYGAVGSGAAPVSRTLSYRNDGDRPVVLRFDARVSGISGDLTRPALRMWPPVLVVHPGREATAQAVLTPGATRPGIYTGHLTARAVGRPGATPALVTVVSLQVRAPDREVTLRATDRDGQPPGFMPVDFWNLDTGETTRAFIPDGETTVTLPGGQYSVVTVVPTGGGLFEDPVSMTVMGDPELTLDADRTLEFDATEGAPVRVETDRLADVDQINVLWYRQVAGREVTEMVAQGWAGSQLYAVESDPATVGVFELQTSWQLSEPLLRAAITGGSPVLPSPHLASDTDRFVGEAELPLVDAGTGTPEEMAAAGVAGKVALVTRRDFCCEQLLAQAQAATEAGAALLLAANDRPGPWREGFFDREVVPTYTLTEAAGDQLRRALAADPDPTLAVAGIADHTYNYQLGFAEPAIPPGAVYDTDEIPLTVVESQYRRTSERLVGVEGWAPFIGPSNFSIGASIPRTAPVARTEYVSAGNVRWQRHGMPSNVCRWAHWAVSQVEEYQPGTVQQQTWWGPMIRPGVAARAGWQELGSPVTRFHDQLRYIFDPYLFDNGRFPGDIVVAPGVLEDTAEVVLRRDGEVIGEDTEPFGFPFAIMDEFPLPAGPEADYQLSLTVTNGQGNVHDLSTRTDSTWSFRTGAAEGAPQVLPLVQVDYRLPAADLDNQVPTGEPYQLLLEPGYQPGVEGPGGFTASVEVSYDGGDTWLPAPVSGDTAQIPPAPATAEFADVRVVATDAAGNALDQRLTRAWRVGDHDLGDPGELLPCGGFPLAR